ncbi:MAG: acetyl-CoA carboxylase biotin carboxyl carrier protein [Planctomycetota bacterium]|jgi:acetyl-CoA carboxylase biotin carboxyl carrier protein
MDAVERVRQLIEIMASHDLAELEVEERDLRVKIVKNAPVQYLPLGMNFAQLPPESSGWHPALQMPAEAEQEPAATAKQNNLAEITSHMVGTFYRSPRPGADSYVSIGSEVDPDTVVCIIEAMKVMNEIKAEVGGTIVEILVQDAEPVEFGQVLFLVEPAEEE